MIVFRIYSQTSGQTLGVFLETRSAAALDSRARDAGYVDHAAACAAGNGESDLAVEEVANAAIVAAELETARAESAQALAALCAYLGVDSSQIRLEDSLDKAHMDPVHMAWRRASRRYGRAIEASRKLA